MKEIVLHILSLIETHPVFFGVIVISFQLFIQHRCTLASQLKNTKDNLKLKIFDELSASIRNASKGAIGTTLWTLPRRIQQYWLFRDQVQAPTTPITDRAEQLRKEYYDFSDQMSRVGACLEQYEVAIKGIKPVRVEFYLQLDKLNSIFSDIFPQLLRFLPFEHYKPSGEVAVREPARPSPEEMNSLKKICDDFYGEMLTLQSYLMDISHIAQNNLIGDIFNNRVEQRKPLQPEKYKVLQVPMPPRDKDEANS